MRNRKHLRRIIAATSAVSTGLLLTMSAALANVPTCDALTLYSSAVNTRLCRSISPANQNLWVCELSDNPDIHTTFNAATALHVTVRINNTIAPQQNCQGNSILNGTWNAYNNAPGQIVIAAGQPNTICNVNITNYINRLNAVPAAPRGNAPSNCAAGFMDANATGYLSAGVAAGYINLCQRNNCP